jgi:hypothetical protein
MSSPFPWRPEARGRLRFRDPAKLFLKPSLVFVAFKLAGGFDEAAMLLARRLNRLRLAFHRAALAALVATDVAAPIRGWVNRRRGYRVSSLPSRKRSIARHPLASTQSSHAPCGSAEVDQVVSKRPIPSRCGTSGSNPSPSSGESVCHTDQATQRMSRPLEGARSSAAGTSASSQCGTG